MNGDAQIDDRGQIERADQVCQRAIQTFDNLDDVQDGLIARYLRGSVALQSAIVLVRAAIQPSQTQGS